MAKWRAIFQGTDVVDGRTAVLIVYTNDLEKIVVKALVTVLSDAAIQDVARRAVAVLEATESAKTVPLVIQPGDTIDITVKPPPDPTPEELARREYFGMLLRREALERHVLGKAIKDTDPVITDLEGKIAGAFLPEYLP